MISSHFLSAKEIDHITQYHIHSQVNKFTFIPSENVQQLIQEMLSHPTLIKPHETKPE